MLATACGGSNGGTAVGTSSGGNTAAQTIRIMAVGDSITHGVRLPIASASWRLPFTMALDTDDCQYEMVGSQTTNENHRAFDSAHEAYSAQEANHFVTGHTNWAGTNEGIFSSLALFSPDVVLMHIGTNDAILAQDNQQTISEIDQIVSTVLDAGAVVLIANVIPAYTQEYLDGVDERIAALGDLIEAYTTQLADPRVHLVDVRSAYTKTMMLDDGIHPNDNGSTHIAFAFYNTLKSAGYCQ